MNSTHQRHRGDEPRQGLQGTSPVLDDVSFTVERGTVFALLGANGSGKTTTINILTTLIEADGGTASVAGFDVATQASKVREQISVTGQFAAVDHVLTARENLVLIGELRHVADPRRDRRGPARHVRSRATLPTAACCTFSGGMRRRLDIAMSLVGDAPIIFFDEPTTGLDPKSRTDMWLTIRQLVERGHHGLPDHPVPRRGRPARRRDRHPPRRHGSSPAARRRAEGQCRPGRRAEFGDEQLAAAASARRAARGQRWTRSCRRHAGSVAEMADMFIRSRQRDRADRFSSSSDAGRRVLQDPRRQGGPHANAH